MARTVPSRQALRHLARLCDNTFIPTRRASLCLATQQTAGPQDGIRRNQRSLSTTFSTRQQATAPTSASSETSNIAAPPLPDTATYYTLFPSTLPSGPPPQGPFQIPLPPLRREYLQLQATHHPDKFPPSSPLHKQSLGLSALLNNAYRTLSSPLLRAQYLLHHFHNIDVTTEDNSQNVTDQATLLEVMEAQEAVEDAHTEAQIAEIKDENDARVRATEDKMSKAFDTGDIETAKRECLRLKYWTSLGQVLHEWEPGKEVRLVH